MMTTICISFPNNFSLKNKKSLQFVQLMQFVQLIINKKIGSGNGLAKRRH